MQEVLSSGREPQQEVEAIAALLEPVYSKITSSTQLRQVDHDDSLLTLIKHKSHLWMLYFDAILMFGNFMRESQE